jgi:biopolymer transport protein ExbB
MSRRVLRSLALMAALAAGSIACAADPVAPSDAPAAAQPESFLRWMARASGPIGVVILGMSFYLIALGAMMAMDYRPVVAMPPGLIQEVNEMVASKRFSEAYAKLCLDPSFLAKTLAAGVRKLPSGLAAAQRAMEMTNEDETMRREHRTTYLATVGTLGPMIGLVGTVYGMIRSFQVMATSGASPQAGQLAEGISTALFATLEGISISVPAIAMYAYFRNKIARLSLEVAILSESMLDGFAPGVRKPHPLAAGTPVRSQPPSPDA